MADKRNTYLKCEDDAASLPHKGDKSIRPKISDVVDIANAGTARPPAWTARRHFLYNLCIICDDTPAT